MFTLFKLSLICPCHLVKNGQIEKSPSTTDKCRTCSCRWPVFVPLPSEMLLVIRFPSRHYFKYLIIAKCHDILPANSPDYFCRLVVVVVDVVPLLSVRSQPSKKSFVDEKVSSRRFAFFNLWTRADQNEFYVRFGHGCWSLLSTGGWNVRFLQLNHLHHGSNEVFDQWAHGRVCDELLSNTRVDEEEGEGGEETAAAASLWFWVGWFDH